MNYDEVKKFIDTAAGKELKQYIIGKLQSLKNIDNIKDIKAATEQVIELKAQKKAYIKLKEILEEIITIETMPEKGQEDDKLYIL